MKKVVFLMMAFGLLVLGRASAADEAAATASDAASTQPASLTSESSPAPDTAAAPKATATADETSAAEPAAGASTENLEFVSGEITSSDEATKTVNVKLYGETVDKASEKSLSVTVDANTDITDGEKDRDLKSLTTGTEVDVEYDPATKKATYIFVY